MNPTNTEAEREKPTGVAELRAKLAAAEARERALWETLKKCEGQAHGGALLGGDDAYKACLKIEAIVTKALTQEAPHG